MGKVWVVKGSRGDDQYQFEKIILGDTTLGRTKTSLVPLISRYASREHIKIIIAPGNKLFLEDLGSLNGTYLNNRKMVPKVEVPVKDKDTVRIGLDTDPENCFLLTFSEETSKDKKKSLISTGAASNGATGGCDEVIVIADEGPAKRVQKPVSTTSTVSRAPSSPDMSRVPKSDLNKLRSQVEQETKQKLNAVSNKRKLLNSSPDAFLVDRQKRLKAIATMKFQKKPTSSLASSTATASADRTNYEQFLQNKRKEANQKKAPILIDPTRLSGRQQSGYATAGERLPEKRPNSPKNGNSSPEIEIEMMPPPLPAVMPSRVAHRSHVPAPSHTVASSHSMTVPVARQATVTASSLLMKNPVTANDAPRPLIARPVIPKPKVTIDMQLHEILGWNANWLKESQRIGAEPDLTKNQLMPLKTSYESHDEYADTHIPYVLYEIWANLVEAYRKNSNKPMADTEYFSAFVTMYEICGHFIRLNLEWPVREGVRKEPMEGDMVIMDVNTEDNFNSGAPIRVFGLGFITDSVPETRFIPQNKQYKVPVGCKKILKLSLLMKKKEVEFKINQNKPVVVLRLDYIRPQLKHIEAILTLKHSQLLVDILKPRTMTCQIPFPRMDEGNLGNKEFNREQHQAILGSAEGVKRGRTLSKILLIQGPPGTGKTHTLIGIIKEIYLTWHPWNAKALPKILVCAPSNGAVDEIGKRLYQIRHFLEKKEAGRSLKCVRVGQDESVKSECIKMTLDYLVESNLNQKAVDNQIKELEKELEKLDIEVSTARYKNHFEKASNIEKEIDRKSREIDRLRKAKSSSGSEEHQRKAMRDDILKKADIVLTTLNSCRASYLEAIFNQGKEAQFDCVIIDEASQCSEPELLMPLCYLSITKVILIGDPMQLPATVKSKKSQEAGFGTSLFERFFKFFGGYNDQTPIHTLTTQFRMHYDICKFPSDKFYDSRLMTNPGSGTDLRFPLKPYTVFDITGTTHNSDDPRNIFNANEASFIIKLCILLNRVLAHDKTVGVITPYQGQKRMIQDRLQNARNFTIKIDVNTIDGFQGQERDVVIFSSVRSSEGLGNGVGFLGSGQRINVALTRAKFALIVCMSKKSLLSSNIWRSLIEDAKQRNVLKEIPCNATSEAIQPLLFHPDAQFLRS